MIRSVLGDRKSRKNAARALSLALAGTLGVGNISGVALALACGGPGSVFWMIISAFAAMVVKYAEIALALNYRFFKDGRYHGGAMYYIRGGLKNKNRAKILASGFALLCLICSLSTGSVIQANAAGEALRGVFGIPPIWTGLLLASLTAAAVSGNAKKVSAITVRLVPLMSALYIVFSLAIIITGADRLPGILTTILKDAFAPGAAAGGITGFLFSNALRYGTARGLFSNEAGCGTSAMAHASSDNASCARQGVWGIFEVFFDTVLLCTLTALVLLIVYNGPPVNDGTGGMMIVIRAFEGAYGRLAGIVLCVSVFLFAYSSIICWSFYGCECLLYLNPRSGKRAQKIYMFLFVVSVAWGACADITLLWSLADFSISAMLCANTACLCALRDKVAALSGEFTNRFKRRAESGDKAA